MKFRDFISGKRDIATVITVAEFRRYRQIFKELYAEDELAHIDDYCKYTWGNNRFLLCPPGHHPVMMYENAVTFIDRFPFRKMEFESGKVKAENGKSVRISIIAHKRGICPVCGNEVDYTGAQVNFLPWKCPHCDSNGKEGRVWLDGNSVFNGVHYDVADKDGHVVANRLAESCVTQKEGAE